MLRNVVERGGWRWRPERDPGRRLGSGDDRSGVDGLHAIGEDEEGIDLDLLHLLALERAPRHGERDLGDRAAVGPGPPTGAVEERPHRELVEHPGDVGRADRKDAVGHVAARLDPGPASSDRENRAQARVPVDADEQLGQGGGGHPGHEGRERLPDRLLAQDSRDLAEGGPHLGLSPHAERDAADVGLMGDARRHDLQRHRSTESLERGDGFALVGHDERRPEEDAEAGEKGSGLGLGQRHAPGLPGPGRLPRAGGGGLGRIPERPARGLPTPVQLRDAAAGDFE